SNSQYLKYCKDLGIKGHPARFPSKLPEFFIKFLTDEDDLVLDIFAGSNTTGWTAQQLNRRWLSFELDHQYLSASVLRFLDKEPFEDVRPKYEMLQLNKNAGIDAEKLLKQGVLFEPSTLYASTFASPTKQRKEPDLQKSLHTQTHGQKESAAKIKVK
ncbi:MAG: site-specific DNA-methyltransferase, partial [Bacteroidales bacterium]|nr:site-specific DNA-methyltransferase [Bacteroidales bacterium]